MKKECILTVTLNPTIDKTVYIPGFKSGSDFLEQRLHVCAGGKGINVARVLKTLKIPAVSTGLIGGHTGDFIRSELDREGLCDHFVGIAGTSRTSLTVIDPDTGRITRILERGPQITDDEVRIFLDCYERLVVRCDLVILSGRTIPGVPDDFYGRLVSIAHSNDCRTVLDTSGTPLAIGLEYKPFLMKPNIAEAEQLLGTPLRSIADMRCAVVTLQAMGASIVALTMGSRGVIAYNGREMIRAVPPKVARRTPVGCGDAFVAGFVTAWRRGDSFSECLRLATACGAANVTSLTPGQLEPELMRSLAGSVTIMAEN